MRDCFFRHFFSGGSALRLGITRCLFYGWFGWTLYCYQPLEYARSSTEFWDPPVLLALFPAPTATFLSFVVAALAITITLSCIGWFTRFATAATAVLGTYVFGQIVSYGDIHFHFSPLILIAMVLPFARTGDAFSLDSLRRRHSDSVPPQLYAWPVYVCQLPLIMMMFTAGCQKLTGNWLSQPVQNMEFFLRRKYFSTAGEKGVELPEMTLHLINSPFLMLMMAAFMLVAEVFSPLALNRKWPRTAALTIFALFLMQLSLAIVFDTIRFLPWLGAYFFFVPWERFSFSRARSERHETTIRLSPDLGRSDVAADRRETGWLQGRSEASKRWG